MADPIVGEIQRIRDIAFQRGEVKTNGFGVDAALWFNSITEKINLMKEVEDRLASDLLTTSANDAGGFASLLKLATDISALVHEAQKERGATGVFLGSNRTKFATELAAQRKLTDTKKRVLEQNLSALAREDLDQKLVDALDQARAAYDQIAAHRARASDGSISAAEGIGFYTKRNVLMLV